MFNNRASAIDVASRASATAVALVAGYSSFSHIAHVALSYGERPEVAYALPFAIDGLLIVATTAMISDKKHNRKVRKSARVAFAFGVLASLAANIASAQPNIGARLVASVPALALLLAIEVLSRKGKLLPAEVVPEPVVLPVEPLSQSSPNGTTYGAFNPSEGSEAPTVKPNRVSAAVRNFQEQAKNMSLPASARAYYENLAAEQAALETAS